MTNLRYSMERLTKSHDRGLFLCGEDALNRYLKEQARQDMKRHCATAIVAVRPNDKIVLGYYTVSAMAIDLNELPETEQKRLPRYEQIPAVLLGRLAVAEQEKGQGLGTLLLEDAIYRACQSEVAWAALVVSAKNESAAAFYRRFDFKPFFSDPFMLWSMRRTIAETRGMEN